MAIVLAVVLLGLFYVFLIRPKQRELKRHNALVASLQVGDDVMTGSGFYGTLTEVTDDTVRIRLAEGVEVKLARRAVAAKIVDPVAPAPAVGAGSGTAGTDDLPGAGRDDVLPTGPGPADAQPGADPRTPDTDTTDTTETTAIDEDADR